MLILTSHACLHSPNTSNSACTSNSSVTSQTTSNSSSKPNNIKICTFNIQNLGVSKLNKPEITAELVSIIRKYDIVAVQEISDVNNTAGSRFLGMINQGQAIQYGMLLSERSGQQPANKNDQEQYTFYCSLKNHRLRRR